MDFHQLQLVCLCLWLILSYQFSFGFICCLSDSQTPVNSNNRNIVEKGQKDTVEILVSLQIMENFTSENHKNLFMMKHTLNAIQRTTKRTKRTTSSAIRGKNIFIRKFCVKMFVHLIQFWDEKRKSIEYCHDFRLLFVIHFLSFGQSNAIARKWLTLQRSTKWWNREISGIFSSFLAAEQENGEEVNKKDQWIWPQYNLIVVVISEFHVNVDKRKTVNRMLMDDVARQSALVLDGSERCFTNDNETKEKSWKGTDVNSVNEMSNHNSITSQQQHQRQMMDETKWSNIIYIVAYRELYFSFALCVCVCVDLTFERGRPSSWDASLFIHNSFDWIFLHALPFGTKWMMMKWARVFHIIRAFLSASFILSNVILFRLSLYEST